MIGRRFLVILALVMGLTAVAASVSPREPRVGQGAGEAVPAPSAQPSPAATTADTVTRTLSADGPPEEIVIGTGDVLELEVEGSELDSVAIESLAKLEPLDPEVPARFLILAEAEGEHPITLLDAEREIGTLVIEDGGA